MDTDMVIDALKDGSSAAGWDCDVDTDRGSIMMTKEMPIGDDYSFVILFDTYDAEELIDQILEAIDEESVEVNSSDFVANLEEGDLSMNDGSAYRYANKLTASLQTLVANVGEAFDEVSFEPEAVALDDVLDDLESDYEDEDPASEYDYDYELDECR